jgi:ammonia channel protein AmtB
MKSSWKTTVAGITAGLAIILSQVSYLFDADPQTVFSVEAVISALGLIGIGFFARDNNVTSEQAGVGA